MQNSFFDSSVDAASIRRRVLELDSAKVAYSVGCTRLAGLQLRNAERSGAVDAGRPPGSGPARCLQPGRHHSMDTGHVETVIGMGTSTKAGGQVPNTLQDLIERCELVVLSANSNHVEEDLREACRLREELGRDQVVLACLADPSTTTRFPTPPTCCVKSSRILPFSPASTGMGPCQPLRQLHRQLRHPNALTAMLGAQLLDRLSPNIQVAAGVHNVEGQYIKAAKNMASVFAGFATPTTRTIPACCRHC